ncbi:hypothetical protein BA724_09980 [Domibacillus iocasae]|uniref:Uncharacterized protein n=1 Tax=Domibacillus iocasae TaxID=1714016 RepID=A0A1E7DNC9_9BACI|nr:hypothetical protein BA724_09980 [Domibacillus iocasae]
MKKLSTKPDVIHLPDLQFIQYCHDQFGINRGVYNTIDAWFFQKGTKNILDRRRKIHHFLMDLQQKSARKKGEKIKFGHGNLTKMLNDYIGSLGSQEHLIS